MHDSGEDLPMRQLIDIPRCVPAVPGLENAGADFLAEQIEELCGLKRVIGLAEVMDFLAVIHGEDRMMDILRLRRIADCICRDMHRMSAGGCCLPICAVVRILS